MNVIAYWEEKIIFYSTNDIFFFNFWSFLCLNTKVFLFSIHWMDCNGLLLVIFFQALKITISKDSTSLCVFIIDMNNQVASFTCLEQYKTEVMKKLEVNNILLTLRTVGLLPCRFCVFLLLFNMFWLYVLILCLSQKGIENPVNI